MAKMSRKGKIKLRKVINYIVSNYELEYFGGYLQTTRLMKFIELLNHKYEIVEYNKDEIIRLVKEDDNIEIKEKESVYGNKYRHLKVVNKYEGEDLSEDVRGILIKEMVATEEMSYNEFQKYVYEEVNKGD